LFEDLQLAISHALDSISNWIDAVFSGAANQLMTAIKQLHFQTTLSILVKILAISFPLSSFLQKKFQDLVTALETAPTVQKNMQRIREKCDIEFEKLFSNVESICDNVIFIIASL